MRFYYELISFCDQYSVRNYFGLRLKIGKKPIGIISGRINQEDSLVSVVSLRVIFLELSSFEVIFIFYFAFIVSLFEIHNFIFDFLEIIFVNETAHIILKVMRHKPRVFDIL